MSLVAGLGSAWGPALEVSRQVQLLIDADRISGHHALTRASVSLRKHMLCNSLHRDGKQGQTWHGD